jgi:hypothetical protein
MQKLEENMKKNNIKMLLSAVILLQALLLIAGTATAVKDSLDRAIIINGTTETVLPRTGEMSNQSKGGYITEIDIYPVLNQTQNWQGFYGNVSGIISLKNPTGQEMYNWSMNMTNTHVYATTESNFLNWTSLFNVNLTHLDYLWFGNKVMADTIEYTYKTFDENRTFVNTSLNASHVRTLALFDDYVVQSVATSANATKEDVLWAARVDAGKLNYKNQSSNYELLVPVDNNNSRYNGNNTYYLSGDVLGDIYYFYMEIP